MSGKRVEPRDVLDRVIETATDVRSMKADISEIKEGVRVFGQKVIQHEVKLNKLPETVHKNTEDIAAMKWMGPTLKGVIGSVVTVFVLMLRQFIAGK